MERIGIWEILLVFLIVIIFFGPKKLPEVGKAIGEAIREFKKSLQGTHDDNQTGAHQGDGNKKK